MSSGATKARTAMVGLAPSSPWIVMEALPSPVLVTGSGDVDAESNSTYSREISSCPSKCGEVGLGEGIAIMNVDVSG